MAQQTIFPGAWLHIPDLSDVGHHTVQDGESFAGLAGRWYGDDHLAIVIAHANQMDVDTEPTPGTVLIRPGLNYRKNVSGDTLETLCRDVYGDGISAHLDGGRGGGELYPPAAQAVRQSDGQLPVVGVTDVTGNAVSWLC